MNRFRISIAILAVGMVFVTVHIAVAVEILFGSVDRPVGIINIVAFLLAWVMGVSTRAVPHQDTDRPLVPSRTAWALGVYVVASTGLVMLLLGRIGVLWGFSAAPVLASVLTANHWYGNSGSVGRSPTVLDGGAALMRWTLWVFVALEVCAYVATWVHRGTAVRVGAVALGAGLVFCTCYFAVVATTLRGRAVRGRLVNSWASLMVFAFVGASFVIGIAERGGNGGGVPFAAVGVGLALSALMTDLGRRQEL